MEDVHESVVQRCTNDQAVEESEDEEEWNGGGWCCQQGLKEEDPREGQEGS